MFACRSTIKNLPLGGVIDARNTAPNRGFAATALSNQAERFALFDAETYIIDGFGIANCVPPEAMPPHEPHFQVAHFEQRLHGSWLLVGYLHDVGLIHGVAGSCLA